MQNGGGAVLGVAGGAEGWDGGVEDGAVGDVVVGLCESISGVMGEGFLLAFLLTGMV